VVCVAFAALLAWVGLGSMVDLRQSVLVVGVLVIAAVSSWWLTVPSGLGLGVVAFLVLDGFVLNSLGQLTWDGMSDGVLALAAFIVPVVAAELGDDVREWRQRRRLSVAARHPAHPRSPDVDT
jgi:hypothetical protein